MAFAFLLFAGMGPPIRAADDDPYSVTVKVDASGDVIGKARDTARLDGQRRALTMLADRLSGGNGAARLPKLDDKAITDLVLSFEVANERMSAVRYAADYTVHFRPEEIRRVLGNPGPGNPGPVVSGDTGKPAVLIPVYQSAGQARLWDDPNPWLQAWEQQPAGTGAMRLVVPLGDAGDIAALDAEKARAG